MASDRRLQLHGAAGGLRPRVVDRVWPHGSGRVPSASARRLAVRARPSLGFGAHDVLRSRQRRGPRRWQEAKRTGGENAGSEIACCAAGVVWELVGRNRLASRGGARSASRRRAPGAGGAALRAPVCDRGLTARVGSLVSAMSHVAQAGAAPPPDCSRCNLEPDVLPIGRAHA